jgi:hypothetical protein
MLIVIILLAASLLLSLSLTLGFWKGEKSLLRALERQQNAAREREAELTDRILSMKGYREFSPAITSVPQIDVWQEEKSVLEEEGFQPY